MPVNDVLGGHATLGRWPTSDESMDSEGDAILLLVES